jgi:hypothetical protein
MHKLLEKIQQVCDACGSDQECRCVDCTIEVKLNGALVKVKGSNREIISVDLTPFQALPTYMLNLLNDEN